MDVGDFIFTASVAELIEGPAFLVAVVGDSGDRCLRIEVATAAASDGDCPSSAPLEPFFTDDPADPLAAIADALADGGSAANGTVIAGTGGRVRV